MNDKELEKLKKQARRLIEKADRTNYSFGDLEMLFISKIANAESMNDLNWLSIQQFEKLYGRFFR